MSYKKNILFVIQNDLMGGAEQLLKALAKEYATKNNTVKVIIMRAPMQSNWNELKDTIEIKYLNTRSYFRGIFKLARFLIGYTRKNQFDYIFSSNININGVLGLLKKLKFLRTKKLIIRETTSVFLRIKGLKKYIHTFKYVIGYSGADLIICQTDLMKRQFLDNLRISHKWNMISIQNPIDVKKTIELSEEDTDVEFKDKKYIVSAGRFIYEKGFDILIHSFSKIANQFPDLDLIILGEGKLKQEYENLINDLNLKERVRLPGFKKNPMPYFKNAELCVVSSRFEGFPNVLLQMLALNDKIVSTLCSGNIDLIPTICTCEINDSELLSQSILKGLQKNLTTEEIDKKNHFLNSIGISDYILKIENKLNHV